MVASRDDVDRAWGRLTGAIAKRDAAGALAAVPAACAVGLFQAAGPAVLLALGPDAPGAEAAARDLACLLYTSPSPRDGLLSRMPSSA